jgi:DNA-binding transcriptional LysR family regulator
MLIFEGSRKEFLGMSLSAEFRYLNTFRVVCESGGVRAAASALHRSEQSVSYQLHRLEEGLGMPLFDRAGGRLRPNPAGLRLLEFCRDMHVAWHRMRDELEQPAQATPLLRVSAVSGYGRYVLRPMFYDGPLANVPIRLSFPTEEGVLQDVRTGHSDLGFVFSTPDTPGLQCEAVDTEELVLVVPRAARGMKLSIEALSGARFVTYDEYDYVFGAWFGHTFGRASENIHSVAHFEELEEVIEWVASGRGISIVPAPCVASHEGSGRVAIVRDSASPCTNTIFAVYRPGEGDAPVIRQALLALRGAA